VKLFDYWYARSSDPSVDDTERFSCVMIRLGTSWPGLLIEPATSAARLADPPRIHAAIETVCSLVNSAFSCVHHLLHGGKGSD
jgi:hypothetical protein